ncbi:MAG: excinuclease ABC subunit UvrA [Candidatus Omnitrophica bacterium]|nr:excinuclease ABC subunit UvrA [Candidatus Omnitrophota bacterium]
MQEYISIQGAKEHNLKNISLKIPKNKLIVVTGLSGSGKSSLAFDTIYAEGQRRYVESLSSYARQFLEQLQKPDVEHIEGLSPAIAIEQRMAGGSPRSIVATQTEVYDYLRLLFSRIGRPHCYLCNRPIEKQTSQEIIEQILKTDSQDKVYILSPAVTGKKGEYHSLFQRLVKEGFARVRIDGEIYDLSEKIKLDKNKAHTIEIVVDRIKVSPEYKKRIADSVEVALNYSKGIISLYNETQKKQTLFNTNLSCVSCGISLSELEPRIFSFNSPFGACPACNGLGTKLEFDLDLIIPDANLSIQDGAFAVWRKGSRGYIMYYRSLIRQLSRDMDFSLDLPFKKLPKAIKRLLLYGSPTALVWGKPFEGIIPHLERLFKNTDSEYAKHEISKYMSKLPCPECNGQRLKKEALSVFINKKSIWDIITMSIESCSSFFDDLKLSVYEEKIAHNVIKEIKKRLSFCLDVGLGYLSLDRLSSTLSGGEAQRIRLATQVGSSLSGVLYVLDEPTIGLHPRDDKKLISTLKNLTGLDNTVIVVEHDEQMIEASDWVIDLGPGAGSDGGKVIFSGDKESLATANTLTAKYLRGEEKVDVPFRRRPYKGVDSLVIKGACQHNLKSINVTIPIGVFVCVTGVSGSGKSTLVEDILYRALTDELYKKKNKTAKYKQITGLELIDKVIIVDQAPIGRTPRSNPATYTGVFTFVREIFSKLPQARARGYKQARFSFNVSGGRCEACRGDGTKRIEMHFLPDVYVACEVCGGRRFNQQTLEVTFKGKSIYDVLNMSIDQAIVLFDNFPQIKRILETLQDVGLGYLKLGQPATTLSGGEAQRMKLASQLRKKATGKTLYVLDEPTTGLHFYDVKKLLSVLQKLVDKKNSVIVIEHNLDVIKCSDYVIDLGPEGGALGGEVVACGAPEEIVKVKASYTGKFLKPKLTITKKEKR